MKITIMVEPQGKARPRMRITKSGKATVYTPSKTVHTEAMIRERMIREGKFDRGVPLYLEATFYRERPKSLAKGITMPISRPDLDNYWKLLTDALEKFSYYNDSQITTTLVKKRFGSPPRIELILEVDDGS